MAAAPRIRLEAPVEQRVAALLDQYGAMATDRAALAAAILRLPSHHSKAWKGQMLALAAADESGTPPAAGSARHMRLVRG